MSTRRTLTDIAFDVINERKEEMTFADIWKDVVVRSGDSNADISQLYSDMMLDSRFVNLKGNIWDLKQNRKFEESFVDLGALEIDDDDDEIEEIEDEDEDSSEFNNEDE